MPAGKFLAGIFWITTPVAQSRPKILISHPTLHEEPLPMLQAAKLNWPYFLPMWIFPVVYLIGCSGADAFGMSFFRFIALPLLFVCLVVSTSPLRRKDISNLQTIFWAGAVPLMVWMVAGYVRSGLVELLH